MDQACRLQMGGPAAWQREDGDLLQAEMTPGRFEHGREATARAGARSVPERKRIEELLLGRPMSKPEFEALCLGAVPVKPQTGNKIASFGERGE